MRKTQPGEHKLEVAELDYKPIGDVVFVRLNPIKKATASGIILPDHTQKRDNSGWVVKVGSGRKLPNGDTVLPPVKVGDRVIYSSYSVRKLNDALTDDDEIVMITDATTTGLIGIISEED
jgi:chaperonin GroES